MNFTDRIKCKITLFITFAFCFCAFSDFDPNQFIIGAWSGPCLQGSTFDINHTPTVAEKAPFQNLEACGFNAFVVDYFDYTNATTHTCYWDDRPNTYILNCLEAANSKLKFFVNLDDLLAYSGKNTLEAQTAATPYSLLLPSRKNHLLGFWIGDEPRGGLINTYANRYEDLKAFNPSLPVFYTHVCNNAADFPIAGQPTNYTIDYVHAFQTIKPWKIMAFDLYSISDNRVLTPPLSPLSFWYNYHLSDVYFFRNYETFITNKRSDQNFWAIIEGARPENFTTFTPNGKSARFALNSALIYGARGIWWYSWMNHNPPPRCFL